MTCPADHSCSVSPLIAVEAEIYLSEADAETTALVIGISESGGATEYYRVDFLSGGSPIPLLRNRRYVINIKNILNSGEPNPGDVLSFNNSPGGITDKAIFTKNTRPGSGLEVSLKALD